MARVLEEMGLGNSWYHGTTAALALLNDQVKKRWCHSVIRFGLIWCFIPVSKMGMIAAVQNGFSEFRKLEAMTAICSVGFGHDRHSRGYAC